MKLIYVAHEFGGDMSNLVRAEQWVAALSEVFDHVFWAPWVPLCRHWVNSGDSLARGMRIDFESIAKSDSIVLCGNKWSPGMKRETDEAKRLGKYVHSLLGSSLEAVTKGEVSVSLAYEFEHQKDICP